MATTLVILAAGLGTRFGGPKQLVPVTPAGEPLFVVTARHALAAGFERVVVVTRNSLQEEVAAVVASWFPAGPVEVVLQDAAAPTRPTPWGTAHAVAVCASVTSGPVAIANSDDFYGREPLARLAGALRGLGPREAIVVGWEVGDTMSSHGPVNRAVCRLDHRGNVIDLHERRGLRWSGATVVDGNGSLVPTDAPVSMNLWGLGDDVATMLAHRFAAFAAAHAADDVEMVLPDELTALMAEGSVTVRYLPSGGSWAGLTFRADLEDVKAAVASATQRSDGAGLDIDDDIVPGSPR